MQGQHLDKKGDYNPKTAHDHSEKIQTNSNTIRNKQLSHQSEEFMHSKMDLGETGERSQNLINITHQLTDGRQEEAINNEQLASLLSKIEEYKMKIQSRKDFESGLELYIKPLGKLNFKAEDVDQESFELEFEIKKRLLASDSELRMLLLSGEAGIGKTLFCKYLQKLMLSEWNTQAQGSDEREWIPILVDVANWDRTVPFDANYTLSEILRQELSLSEGEIKKLQENDLINAQLPGFLFIFDEYGMILQKQQVKPLNRWTIQECAQNNFCASSGFKTFWKQAKIILTIRSETLSLITRRDLLFGPLDTSQMSLIPDSFAEYQIIPFDDTQISSYLKKYLVSCQDLPFDSNSKSWILVRIMENIADSCGLRELIRVPVNLGMFAWGFPVLWNEQGSEESTRFQLYEQFTSHYIRSTIDSYLESKREWNEDQEEQLEGDTDYIYNKLTQELQNLAIRLSGYYHPHPNLETENKQKDEENNALYQLCPLIRIDDTGVTHPLAFIHRIYQDFYVAQKIIDQILDDSGHIVLRRELFNQKHLYSDPSSILVFQFLVDAVIAQKIPIASLMKLIQRSKVNGLADSKQRKQKEEDEEEEKRTNFESKDAQEKQRGQGTTISQENEVQDRYSLHHQNHCFSIAAANAITILNASGYQFTAADLSEICIAGAQLSKGNFQRANFTGADLQGVNFSGTNLRDTKFANANLEEVQFGVVPDLKLDKEALCIAHSPDGTHMIVGTRGEIIVFEKNAIHAPFIREAKRLKGHVGEINSCTFSMDGKYIISGGEDRTVRIWDFEMGQCIQILSGHTSRIINCEFSQDGRHLISVEEDQTVKKWSLSNGEWRPSFEIHRNSLTNCGFIPDCDKLIYFGHGNHKSIHCHSLSGQHIRTFRTIKENFAASQLSFSREAKQAIAGFTDGSTIILDSIRGHVVKTLKDEDYNGNVKQYRLVNPSFASRSKEIISATIHMGRDVMQVQNSADGEIELHYAPLHEAALSRCYSADPVYQTNIALVTESKTISLIETTRLPRDFQTAIKHNLRQVDKFFAGANIDNAFGLSEENIMIFDQVGEYKGIGKDQIRKLFLNSRISDLEKITTVELSDRKLDWRSARIISRNSKWINLRRLDLSTNNIFNGNEDFVTLAANQTWTKLQELILNYNKLRDEDATTISENSCWKDLRLLQLKSTPLSNLGGVSIGKNTIWENLEELDLSQNRIGDEGAIAIGNNHIWRNLKRLDLGYNEIGDKGAGSIASNETWTCLECLDLSRNSIGDIGATQIGKNRVWVNLKQLSLERNQIGDSGASVILENAAWKILEELYLFHNHLNEVFIYKLETKNIWSARKNLKIFIFRIGNRAIQSILNNEDTQVTQIWIQAEELDDSDAIVIAKMKNWTNLNELILPFNKIVDEGAFSIGSNTTWKDLEILNLQGNKIGNKGALAIGNNTTWHNLKFLCLSSNRIGDEGAIAIGKNTTWIHLETLRLFDNLIGDEGAAAIGMNSTWVKLKQLSLYKNKIGDKGGALIGANTTWIYLDEISLEENEMRDKTAIEIRKNTTWINLQMLSLNKNKIGDEEAASIASNTTWIYLKRLQLAENEIGAKGAIAIGNNTTWSNLKELCLSRNRIGDDGAVAIGSNITWTKLKILRLEQNEIGAKGAIAIGSNTIWSHLKKLAFNQNRIGDEGATAIGTNTTWTNLEPLLLSENEVGDKGVAAIGNNTTWTLLKKLALNGNRIGDEGFVSLGSNTTWENLRTLDLYKNEIGDKVAEAIGCNTWRLRDNLYLNANKISDKGAIAIGNNTTWGHLRVLHLDRTNIGDEGAVFIGTKTAWGNLRKLSLSENKIGDKGASAIGSNTSWPRLHELNLSVNQIGDKGAAVIGANTTWKNLQQLYLNYNEIRDEGAIAIGNNTTWNELKVLDLSGNRIGEKGAVALGSNTTWTSLAELHLSHNNIGDTGAFSIGKNVIWKQLRCLMLDLNNISDKGAISIGSNTVWNDLEILSLRGNEIGDKGAAVFGSNTTWSKLKQLYLNTNNISDDGGISIAKNTAWTNIEELHIYNNDLKNEKMIRQAFTSHPWKNLESFVYITNPALKNFVEPRKKRINNKKIRDEGAIAIGLNTAWIKLERLHLHNSKIGEKGAEANRKNSNWSKVKELLLGFKAIEKKEEPVLVRPNSKLIDPKQNKTRVAPEEVLISGSKLDKTQEILPLLEIDLSQPSKPNVSQEQKKNCLMKICHSCLEMIRKKKK